MMQPANYTFLAAALALAAVGHTAPGEPSCRPNNIDLVQSSTNDDRTVAINIPMEMKKPYDVFLPSEA